MLAAEARIGLEQDGGSRGKDPRGPLRVIPAAFFPSDKFSGILVLWVGIDGERMQRERSTGRGEARRDARTSCRSVPSGCECHGRDARLGLGLGEPGRPSRRCCRGRTDKGHAADSGPDAAAPAPRLHRSPWSAARRLEPLTQTRRFTRD